MIHLKAQGLAQESQKNQKRRKWVRYEREHSLSAGHIDWHEVDGTDIKICVILDDASRNGPGRWRVLGYQCREQQAGNRSAGGKVLVALPMRELILDHGSEFSAHRIHDDGSWKSNLRIT